MTAAQVSAIALTEKPAELAARLGVKVRDGNYVDLELKDSDFGRLHLGWEDESHITSFNLAQRSGVVPPSAVEKLRAQLGRSLRGVPSNLQLSSHGVNLSVSSSIALNAPSRDDPRWKARVAALWQAVKHAAFDSAPALDARTRRDVLNLDYALADIAKIDPSTSIDASAEETRRVFAGSVTRDKQQLVGLGHPWFDNAVLDWENRRGGRLKMVNAYFTPELVAKPDLAAVNRCLEPLLGKAREIETDYAARRVEYDWRGRAGFPRVYATHQLVMIFNDAFGSEPTRNSEWNRVFARLGECGGGS